MYIAEFEKVSLEQFIKDYRSMVNEDVGEESLRQIYDDIRLPKRATSGSAGYDFYSTATIELKPNETTRIPSGIRVRMDKGYVLNLYPRSSFGLKYQMSLLNTVGIIDSDYYFAENEGHIIIGIVNRGDQTMRINIGERFVQGLFGAYYLALEADVVNKRSGGFGSSGKD